MFGQTLVLMKEISFKIIFMALVSTDGQMVEYIKESGQIIKWKVKVFSHGVTAVGMLAATKMIRSMVMVHSNGLMVVST